MIRGGSWNGNAANCRSGYRNANEPANRNRNVGFRVLRPCSSETKSRMTRVAEQETFLSVGELRLTDGENEMGSPVLVGRADASPKAPGSSALSAMPIGLARGTDNSSAPAAGGPSSRKTQTWPADRKLDAPVMDRHRKDMAFG